MRPTPPLKTPKHSKSDCAFVAALMEYSVQDRLGTEHLALEFIWENLVLEFYWKLMKAVALKW